MITLDQNSDQEKGVQLNRRLLTETLNKDEKTCAEYLQKYLSDIHFFDHNISPIKTGDQTRIYRIIYGQMNELATGFLKCIFAAEPIPEWRPSADSGFPQILCSSVDDWYKEAILTTMNLQQIVYMAYTWMKLSPEFSFGFAKTIQSEAKKCIQNFWAVMQESGYISDFQTWDCTYQSAIDSAVISAEIFKIHRFRNDIEKFFLDSGLDNVSAYVVLSACAVTLEFFWRKHTCVYAQYYVDKYMWFHNVLHSYSK